MWELALEHLYNETNRATLRVGYLDERVIWTSQGKRLTQNHSSYGGVTVDAPVVQGEPSVYDSEAVRSEAVKPRSGRQIAGTDFEHASTCQVMPHMQNMNPEVPVAVCGIARK